MRVVREWGAPPHDWCGMPKLLHADHSSPCEHGSGAVILLNFSLGRRGGALAGCHGQLAQKLAGLQKQGSLGPHGFKHAATSGLARSPVCLPAECLLLSVSA